MQRFAVFLVLALISALATWGQNPTPPTGYVSPVAPTLKQPTTGDWTFWKVDGSGNLLVDTAAGGAVQGQTPPISFVTPFAPVALDPSGNWKFLQVDANGNLLVSGAGGASTFLALSDTPSSYSGQGSKCVAVNSGATALEFIACAGGAPSNVQYLVLAVDGTLTVERRFVVSVPLETNDGGAGGDFTVSCRPASAAQSGCLEAGDFSTFNSKIGGSGTTNTLPLFTASGTIGNSSVTEDADSVNFAKKIEVAELVITGAGAGYWEWTTGALGTSTTNTVRCGAHTGNVFSCSESGGAVTPVIIGTRVNFPNGSPTDDNLFVGNGSAWQSKAISNGPLSYSTSSNTFSTTVRSVAFEGATPDGSTASFSLDKCVGLTAGAATVVAGSNVARATLNLDAATDEGGCGSFYLPADWGGTLDLEVEAEAAEAGTNVARLSIATVCVGAGETFDPSYGTPQTFAWTNTGSAQRVTATQSSVTVTGCAAGERLFFKFFRDGDGTSGTDSLGVDLRLIALRFKY